jgi:hypothetical protein
MSCQPEEQQEREREENKRKKKIWKKEMGRMVGLILLCPSADVNGPLLYILEAHERGLNRP